jgi:hypothetical protein
VLHEAECEKKALELLGELLPDEYTNVTMTARNDGGCAPPTLPPDPIGDVSSPVMPVTHSNPNIGLDLEWKTTFEVPARD